VVEEDESEPEPETKEYDDDDDDDDDDVDDYDGVLCPSGTRFVSSIGKCAETSDGCRAGYKWNGAECRMPSAGMITYDPLNTFDSPPPPASDSVQTYAETSEAHAWPGVKSCVMTMMTTAFFAATLAQILLQD
jgi:hypothetical protein